MFCTKCGKQISNDSQFCTYCGAPTGFISTASQNKQQTSSVTPHNNQTNNFASNMPSSKPPKKSGSLPLIIILIVVFLVLILGIGSFAAYKLFFAEDALFATEDEDEEDDDEDEEDDEDRHSQHSDGSSLFSGLFGSSAEATVTTEEVATEALEATAETAAEESATIVSDEEVRSIRRKYAEILDDLCATSKLPDMSSPVETNGSMSYNNYAIYDVDGDNYEELIISIGDTYMAGMVEIVYGYNPSTDKLQIELTGFPGINYFDNGVVTIGWSHNQGLGPEFWPFDLYIYDPYNDVYQYTGSVDSWDKYYYEEDYNGNAFPNAIDQDGDGQIFQIGDIYNDYDSLTYVDNDKYQEWYDYYLKDAGNIYPNFLSIDSSNYGQYLD